MPISIAARQRVVTGLWGGRKAGSFAGRAPTVLAVITGTATASITEADVVAGSRTIIITLTNDTWATAGASFDAQRQAIINGLDSAQAEATGWNTVIRDAEVVGAVIRTSDTVVTITLTAAATYNITATETITVTVPSAALATSLSDVTGTPTFTVSAVAIGQSGVRHKPLIVRLSDLGDRERKSTAEFIKAHLARQPEVAAPAAKPLGYKVGAKSTARQQQERLAQEALRNMEIEAENEQRIIRINNAIIAIIIASES